MPISERVFLTFDDLTILPGANRGTADEVELHGRVSRAQGLALPILSAAMPSVTGADMAVAMGELGGLGVLHRAGTIAEQCTMVGRVVGHRPELDVYPHASVGPDGGMLCAASVSPGDVDRAVALVEAGARLLFLDTPNPTNHEVFAGARAIRESVDAQLVIGSVVDARTAGRYIEMGVDGIKVGLGSGAMCSMRRATGVGVPQVTALVSVVEVARAAGVPVISDGGARCSGDIVKALAVGASSVMLGSMLAGCSETPPPLRVVDGVGVKELSGLRFGDLEIAPPTGLPAVDAYLREHQAPRVEGGDATIPWLGPCHLRLLQLARGLRSGVHMAGARDLSELADHAQLVRVSGAGGAEAHINGGSR